ncbi:MAG: hypothetical protein HBSAPP03_27570 [Phycisphaerae bacterium]|nr:MAG: hypothetical protein HBSAPP03_27570 [Phycisphaerae bacterium]
MLAPEVSADTELASSIEALLLSVERPLTPQRLAEAIGLLNPAEDDADSSPAAESTRGKIDQAARKEALGRIDRAVNALNAAYEQTGRSFRVESVAGGYRILTLPKFAPVIAELHSARAGHKLSRQAVETLAIIAYKQPITRAQLEAIRGVSCGEVLRSLIERRLITVRGRAEELGRPLLYGTTKSFLDAFGLSSITDLPSPAELRAAGT